jgi:hypothetical protein
VGLVVAAALRQIDAAMVCIGGGKTLSGALPGATHEQKGDRGSASSGDKAMSPSGGQPAQSTTETTSFSPARAVDRLEQGLKRSNNYCALSRDREFDRDISCGSRAMRRGGSGRTSPRVLRAPMGFRNGSAMTSFARPTARSENRNISLIAYATERTTDANKCE